jgi:hypothetical protein
MQTLVEPTKTEPAMVRWCLGLPKVGERSLRPAELDALRLWLRRTRRTRLASLFAAGALLLTPAFYLLLAAPELLPAGRPQEVGFALLAYLGACIGLCGVAGAVWEICWPQRTWHRPLFALALGLSALSTWWLSPRLRHLPELILLGVIVPVLGCAAFVARTLKQALLGPRLAGLERDLADARLEVFRGPSERLGSEREQVPEGLMHDAGRVTLEVLPRAGLPWSSPMANGSAIVLLRIRETPQRAELPESPLIHEDAAAGVDFGQRVLTMAEREELSRYAQLLTRRAVIHGLVIFWFIALVVPMVAKLTVPAVHSRVSFAAGCIALVTGFMRGAAILQHRAKVQLDAAEGLVVIVPPGADDDVETEFLPQSDLEWTVARAMAPWRHKLQAKR